MSSPHPDRDRERAWATAAQAGDRAAMEALLDALYDQLYAVCRRICANDADAEDVTQDALISIVRALPRFDGRSAVRTWAHQIAANAALDELRRRSRRPLISPDARADTDLTDGGPPLDDRVSDRLDLDRALARLSDDHRTAVVLRDVAGLEYADIAAALDIPIGTVRSRIARGRAQLAEALGIAGNRSSRPVVSSEEP